MDVTCGWCGKTFRVKSGKEDVAEYYLKEKKPVFCSRGCRAIYWEQQMELDRIDAEGIGASGHNPLND